MARLRIVPQDGASSNKRTHEIVSKQNIKKPDNVVPIKHICKEKFFRNLLIFSSLLNIILLIWR